MVFLLAICLLLCAGHGTAQEPALWLEVDRDSLGVGDTLEVRLWVDAGPRRLTSAGAVVVAEEGIFAPLEDAPFAAGEFLPGEPYDNAALSQGGALQLRFVAVSGAAEEGERPAGTGRGELARVRLRAMAPAQAASLRLEGTGPRRAMYTAQDQPGMEQRFALPEAPLQVRVGGQVLWTPPSPLPEPAPLPPAAPIPETPPLLPPEPPANTPPTIAPLPALNAALGGESWGPLLARYLEDAEDPVGALRVGVEGDGKVAVRLEAGRLVVRGLEAGLGRVSVRVTDTEGAWAEAGFEVEVRAAGQGPLLRALPRVGLRVGGERALDLSAYVYDPDTPLAELSWSLAAEGGVEAALAGAVLNLKATSLGLAQVGLQVRDPEGNAALAVLAVQVEEALPAVADSSGPIAVDEPPSSEPPETPLPELMPDTLRSEALPDTLEPEAPPPAGVQPEPLPDTTPAQVAPDTLQPLLPPADPLPAVEPEEEVVVDSAAVSQPPAPQPAAPDTPAESIIPADPDTLAGPISPADPVAPLPPTPFDPLAEETVPAVPTSAEPPPASGAAPAPAADLLAIEREVQYQVVAGRLDSGLVADRWVLKGEGAQVQWSLRGGKRLSLRLDPESRRLFIDARDALPGREVFFAEAALGGERRQLVLAVEVRAPRLDLLPFPSLRLGAGQELSLDLDSFAQGDFAPEELVWSAEAPAGALVELDAGARVLRIRESGDFVLRLEARSPWGNRAGAQLEVRGGPLPELPAVVPPESSPPIEAEPLVPAPTPPAEPEPLPLTPADQTPPRLWLREQAQGSALALWLEADEVLGAPPQVRANGQVVVAEAGAGGFRILLAPLQGQVRVEVEGVDLAGNTGWAALVLAAGQVEPGAGPLSSPDGRWQVAFPQVRGRAWVWFREEGEGQGLSFDAAQTGPAEVVAQYRGSRAPAILRDQGEGWEELPTLALEGSGQVYARSEGGGVFKLAGSAGGAMPEGPLAYPNPFNAQALIRYQVEAEGPVRVRVRDGQGRLMRLLVDRAQGPGVWTAIWDGRDQDGRQAASGVYYCEIEAAGARRVGKLLLLR